MATIRITTTVEIIESGGYNPRYFAADVERGLDGASARMTKAVASQFGDIRVHKSA